jgi:serine protease SohB
VIEFFADYGMFLLKTLTLVVALGLAVAIVVAASGKGHSSEAGNIEVKSLNERYTHMRETLEDAVLDEASLKKLAKEEKQKLKKEKAEQKKTAKTDTDAGVTKKRVFVLDFDGDIRAQAVDTMREEISAILTIATENDEVVLKLESGGGVVHGYGLAASQLSRIKDKSIPLTICVDKVAASGGYMMACIASKILAAPFAMVGSIGVVAQVPNFHKILKKNDVDYELFTAGEYKRTVTMFGENTDKAREKFSLELEETHELFKDFVGKNRPSIDVPKVATGEVWFGQQAVDLDLVDELGTSDQYLMEASANADVYSVTYKTKKSLQEKLGIGVENALVKTFDRAFKELRDNKFMA